MRASDHPDVQRFARHVNPRLVTLLGVLGYGRLFTEATGSWLTDHAGQRYLDALAGFGTLVAGHHPARLDQRLTRALDEEAWGDEAGPRARELSARLAKLAGLDVARLASSGAEAVDQGLRLCLAATGRPGIVHAAHAYHGLNLGALSAAGQERVHRPFAPLLPVRREVPYGDLDALDRALAPGDVAAVLLEPIQIEGGVRPAPAGYLAGARTLCDRHGARLLLDEIQTGLGRTGAMFAAQREGVSPDVMVLGKALGGGLVALSATVARGELVAQATARSPELSAAVRVAGVEVASAVGLEVLAMLDEGLVAAAAARGDELLGGLRARLVGHPLVREVRGCGLLVGLELGAPGRLGQLGGGPAPVGHWVSFRLLEEGVICQPTTHRLDVLRLEPPLTISSADNALLIERVGTVLDGCRSVPAVLAALGARLLRQTLSRGAFG